MTWLRSTLRRLSTTRTAVAGLGALVFVTAFIFAVTPRVIDSIADVTLRAELATGQPVAVNLTLSEARQIAAAGSGDPLDSVRAHGEALAAQLPAAVAAIVSRPAAVVDTPRFTVTNAALEPETLAFRFQDGAADRITVTQGRAPTAAATAQPDPSAPAGSDGQLPVFEGDISESTAATLKIGVGDLVPLALDQSDPLGHGSLGVRPRWAVRIVGLFRPLDAADPAWFGEPGILDASVRVFGPSLAILDGRVLLDSASYAAVFTAGDQAGISLRYQWRFFTDQAALSSRDLATLIGALRRTESIFPRSTPSGNTSAATRLTSNLAGLLDEARSRWAVAAAMMGTGAAGPATMAIASLGLVALLAARRRRAAAAAWRTRGASTAQVLRATLGEGLLVAGPAAVAATALAIVAVPGAAPGVSLIAGATVLAAAVLAVGLLEIPPALMPRGAAARAGEGGAAVLPPGAAAPTRRALAAEVLIVILAVAAVVLLLQKAPAAAAGGATGGTGTGSASLGPATPPATANPLLAAAPALAGIAAAIIARRIIPFLLRGVAWLAARRRDLVPALAMRRAVRQGGSTAVVLVLFANTAITTFAAATVRTLDAGADIVAWQQVGAEQHVSATFGGLPPALQSGRLPADPTSGAGAGPSATEAGASAGVSAPGAEPGALAVRTTATIGADLESFDLLAIALPAWVHLVAGTPAAADLPAEMLVAHPESLPVIVSSSVAARAALTLGQTYPILVQGRRVTAHLVAIRDTFPTLNPGGTFIVFSLDQLEVLAPGANLAPTDLFLATPSGGRAAVLATLAQFGPSVTLASRAEVATAIRERPLNRAVGIVVLLAVLAGVAYAALALIAGLVIAGSARSTEVGHLRMLGLARRDAMVLLALEFGPVLAVALVVAAALGIGLFLLIGHVLGIGVLLGSSLEIPLAVEPWVLLAVVAGTLLLTVAAIGAAGLLQQRTQAAGAIRAGIE